MIFEFEFVTVSRDSRFQSNIHTRFWFHNVVYFIYRNFESYLLSSLRVRKQCGSVCDLSRLFLVYVIMSFKFFIFNALNLTMNVFWYMNSYFIYSFEYLLKIVQNDADFMLNLWQIS